MMKAWFGTLAGLCLCTAGAVTGSLISPAALAGDVSEREIIQKLAPPRTRGLAPPRSSEDRAFIRRLHDRTTRSLTAPDRDRIAKVAEARPTVNLAVYFDFDSAAITPKAVPQLNALGRALTAPELRGAAILVAGHTDAKGGDAYNQDLSQRRADAVKQFLVDNFTLPAANLTVVGYGEQQLENKSHPFAAENRRVQIVNLASRQEAKHQ